MIFLRNSLRKQEALQISINLEKEANRNAKRSISEHVSMKNNVLLLIYNAGESGITVAEIMQNVPTKNKKVSYNIHTINRDWNVNAAVQSEQINLNEKGIMVAFEIDVNNESCSTLKGKQNNRITLPSVFADTLKDYLLSKNVTEEMLTL